MLSPVEKWQDPLAVEAIARPHYSDELEFHNWEHAQAVRDGTLANAQACADNGLEINTEPLLGASLLHDADWWLKPRGSNGGPADHTYKTKERYSAALAWKEMSLIGMPYTVGNHMQDIIKSSEAGVPCKSLEAKCFRQADLANVANPNPFVFLNSTYRLYKETKRLNQEPVPHPTLDLPGFVRDFLGFAAVSYEILSTYNAEDVSLGDFDRDQEGRSIFGMRAASNIERLVPDKLEAILAKNIFKVISYKPVGI